MTTPRHIPRRSRPTAFSLVELLVVIGLVSLLAAVGSLSLSSGGSADAFRNAGRLATLCELAAQEAKAGNRWVYLFLRENSAEQALEVVLVAGKAGGDPYASASSVDIGDGSAELLSRPQYLKGVKVSTNVDEFYSGRTFTSSDRTYSKSVVFSPTGQVAADPATFQSAIRVGLVDNNGPADALAAVMKLSTLTGMTRVIDTSNIP